MRHGAIDRRLQFASTEYGMSLGLTSPLRSTPHGTIYLSNAGRHPYRKSQEPGDTSRGGGAPSRSRLADLARFGLAAVVGDKSP